MLRRVRAAHHKKSVLQRLFSLHRSADKPFISSELQKRTLEISKKNVGELLTELSSSFAGLSLKVSTRRIKEGGRNEIISEGPPTWYQVLFNNITNPFVLLLLALSLLSWFLGNILGLSIILGMVLIGVGIRFFQEYRSNSAAAKLNALVGTTATVIRGSGENDREEINLKDLAVGDVVFLSAGDMIPADLRVIYAHDLFVSQSSLTGESRPIEKGVDSEEEAFSLGLKNICFMGTNVVSGIGKGVVIATGDRTYFGSIAHAISSKRPMTSFDIGINKVSLLLIKLMICMIPLVFLVNGLGKGDWIESLLFALSVAVGLTPEMLPMIVTTNLARGALAMAKKKVIVKQLSSIQNFGAMDVLCTDKTGTLTEDKVVLEQYLDCEGKENVEVLGFAYFNSYFQTGLKNLLDKAILEHSECWERAQKVSKIDEIPYDFERKRMSVVIEENGKRWLVCKGSVESVLSISNSVNTNGLYEDLNKKGLRVLGLARKELRVDATQVYHPTDESDLTFLGFLVFLDPPKESATEAIKNLQAAGISIKVLTGDDRYITEKVCEWVGLRVEGVITGRELEAMEVDEKREKIERATIFVKLSPLQKGEIIQLIKQNGHTVGFLGDGINDAPALREADIGISVESSVDIAKESSDIIMLEKSLLFLSEGVLIGRKTFANILKYIKMAISSNFGNVLSILGASLILPFLPMLPLQLLLQNLLYDISQIAIPFDHVDKEDLEKPRQWSSSGITRFMFFVGPISSVFDYITFGILWFVIGANSWGTSALFQSGWFMEGLLSQTLIVHMIRTAKIPFFQSHCSAALFLSTLGVIGVGLTIPYTLVGRAVGMTQMPSIYFFYLALIVIGYCITTQILKWFFLRRFKVWL